MLERQYKKEASESTYSMNIDTPGEREIDDICSNKAQIVGLMT